MIRESYCSFEVSKLLSLKGFDELCIFKYDSEGNRQKAGAAIDEWQNSEFDDDEYSCVTHQMAMAWLREKGWHITIDCIDVTETGLVFTIKIVDMKSFFEYKIDYDSTYEKAAEEALKFTLEKLVDMNEIERLNLEIQDLVDRETGRTTRLVDEYIQKLYDNQGEWVSIIDHFPSKMADKQLLEKILQRVFYEHSNDKVEVDKIHNKLKLVSCSRDYVRERLDNLIKRYEELKGNDKK